MNGLELGRAALALWRSVRGNESLDQQCQRLSGYYTQWAYQGHDEGIAVYASANAAAAASPRDGSLVNEMPVGGFGYWDIGRFGHVAMCIGYNGKRALILHTSAQGDEVTRLDPFWRVSHADTYPHPFRFWSFTNGRNPRMTVAPWSPRPANARQVGSGGARRREEPTTLASNWDDAENFAPGAWVEWDGFIRSTLPGGQPNGDNIWLKKGSLYTAWAAMVPLAGNSLLGIKDLGTFSPPPVFHKVSFVTEPGLPASFQSVENGKTATRPSDPVRGGFVFDGWLDPKGQSFDFSTPVKASFTLSAKWIAEPKDEKTPAWFKDFLRAILNALQSFLLK